VVITEEKEEREGEMSKFKVGDRVRCVEDGPSWLNGAPTYQGFEGVVESTERGSPYNLIGFRGGSCLYSEERFKLIQDNKEKEMPDTEKKYKIATELSLQEVANLKRALIFASGFVELHEELSIIYREAKRKVVKVGDKEYYEDELSAALANIKPIK
jgi:hypothetical protein